MGTTVTDNKKRQAEAAAEEARARIEALSEERGRVFLRELEGEEGAEEEGRRLDAELEALVRRAEMADAAAEEARKRAEELARKRADRERAAARTEYDRLVEERCPLLEAVEDAFDNLDAAINAAQLHDHQQSEVCTRAGLPHGGNFASLLSGRIGARMIHHAPGGFIRHQVYEQPLTATDPMGKTAAELEEEQQAEARRLGEEAEARLHAEELADLSEKILRRRDELIKAHGGWNADVGQSKREAARRKADEILKEEFPILQKGD